MEKSALVRLKSLFFQAFSGFDPRLGLIFLALALISFFVFLSAGQGTPVALMDQARGIGDSLRR